MRTPRVLALPGCGARPPAASRRRLTARTALWNTTISPSPRFLTSVPPDAVDARAAGRSAHGAAPRRLVADLGKERGGPHQVREHHRDRLSCRRPASNPAAMRTAQAMFPHRTLSTHNTRFTWLPWPGGAERGGGVDRRVGDRPERSVELGQDDSRRGLQRRSRRKANAGSSTRWTTTSPKVPFDWVTAGKHVGVHADEGVVLEHRRR